MNPKPPAEPALVHQPPPSPAALPRGHRLPGFEIQEETEADGVVDDCRSYRAWDLALLRPVVVTEYLPPALVRRGDGGEVVPATRELAPGYAAGLDHFLEQTRGLAQADHPHLLRVLHVLLAHGTAYRVQPAYRGECLQRLRQRMPGPPDEDVLLGLLDEMLAALQVFHDVGAVHCAVHPARILVLDDDSSLLLAPRTGGSAQADPYAAPELQTGAAGAAIGAWSDCYALARVARFCITGKVPAPHPDAASEPLALVIDGLSAAHRAMRYTPALLHVLDLAASADVARRPQSATEFREWLDQARQAPVPRPAIPTDEEAARAVHSLIAALPPRADASARIDPPPIGPMPIEPSPATVAAAPAHAPAAPAAAKPARSKRTAAALASVAGLAVAATLAWIWWAPDALPTLSLSALMPTRQETPAGAPRQPAPTPSAVPVAAAPTTDFGALPAPAAGPASTAAVGAAPLQLPAEPPAEPSVEPPVKPPVEPPVEQPIQPPIQPPVKRPIEPASRPPAEPQPELPPPPRAAKASEKAVVQTRSPRERCGERTPFALYRCMQRECAVSGSRQHPQCVQLHATDRVD